MIETMDRNDVDDWINKRVYRNFLWVKIVLEGDMIATGIAEYDPEAQAGVLEWSQINPNYRKRLW